jgi:hypothetical protein
MPRCGWSPPTSASRSRSRAAKTRSSFEVVFFAPLAGFILAPDNDAKMSVSVVFPPQWAAKGMNIGEPTITAVPGQPAPETKVEGPTQIGARPIYGALWRRDPKVTIPYSYE